MIRSAVDTASHCSTLELYPQHFPHDTPSLSMSEETGKHLALIGKLLVFRTSRLYHLRYIPHGTHSCAKADTEPGTSQRQAHS
jgi:hypothetical protein